MNVVFWNGGIPWGMSRTIGPYKVAYWLRKHNYSAQVVDFIEKMPEDVLYSATKRFINDKTLVLAISTSFMGIEFFTHSTGRRAWLTEAAFNVLTKIKQEHPNIKIILGGYKSEKLGGLGLVDATIMSYTTASEEIMLEYLNYLTTGTEPPEHRMYGIGPNKRIVYDKARNPVYNIEIDDFKWSKQDVILPGEPLPLDVSRGCIFACRFCQYPHLGKKKLDYIRGMEYLEAELIHNYETFGTTSYYIMDDTFNDTETKLKAFHDMTKTLPFKIIYTTYLRADLIHRFPDMAYYLQESGLYGAFFGIESLHPEASKIVGKAWSGKHAKEYVPELFHNIWKKKVPVHTNFIVGITGEPPESIVSTTDWFIQNDLHSINFERLALLGPNDDPVWSIKSEFDKNASKYGFTMMPPANGSIFPDWKNDYWTRDIATHHMNEANKKLYDYRKIQTWSIPSMLWQGFTKDDIENRLRKDYPTELLTEYRNQKLREYFKAIMTVETDC